MANPNEIAVELRLKLDKLRQDTKAAGAEINKGISETSKTFYPATLSSGVDERRRIAAEDLRRMRQQGLRGYNAQEFFRNQRPAVPTSGSMNNMPSMEEFLKNRAVGGGGVIPSILGKAAGAGGGAVAGGAGAGVGIAASAAGIAAALAPITIAVGAVIVAFEGLKKMVETVAAAADHARQLYAKQAQSGGMAKNFVITRSLLAQVMGVSEDEVMQYGNAIGFLNDKISGAAEIFARTNNVLTATSWNIKAMEISFQELSSSLSAELAPAITQFANLIRLTADFAAHSTILALVFKAIGNILMGFEFIAKMAVAAVATFTATMETFVASILWVVQKVNNALASLHIPGFKKDDNDVFADVKKQWEDIGKMLTGAGGTSAPNMPVSTNRMPASSWEKMGMVIGNMGSADHAKTTADNTTKMVGLLQKIAGVGQTSKNQPWGLMDSSLGYPNQAAP